MRVNLIWAAQHSNSHKTTAVPSGKDSSGPPQPPPPPVAAPTPFRRALPLDAAPSDPEEMPPPLATFERAPDCPVELAATPEKDEGDAEHEDETPATVSDEAAGLLIPVMSVAVENEVFPDPFVTPAPAPPPIDPALTRSSGSDIHIFNPSLITWCVEVATFRRKSQRRTLSGYKMLE